MTGLVVGMSICRDRFREAAPAMEPPPLAPLGPIPESSEIRGPATPALPFCTTPTISASDVCPSSSSETYQIRKRHVEGGANDL